MAEIELRDITKIFGDITALNELSFTLGEHEFLVILGPSGAGKTTTLRTVAGLERPDRGRVLIDGDDVTKAEPATRNVAFVFQNYALYPFMTVEQNMAFPLKARRRMSKRDIARRVREVAGVLQIEPLLKRKPTQLSGGQQQRVALGRAMVRRARAFLMDEPLTNLDAKLRTLMRSELKHLQRDQGATTLYVTHDQVEAMTMGDRILVLREGTLQQVGSPHQIYNQPTNIFVAGFVGSPRMNLLPVHPGDDGTLVVEGYDTLLPLKGRVRQAYDRATLREFVLGARPEDVVLSATAEPEMLQATVYASEPLGDRTIYDLRIGSQLMKVKASAHLVVNIGDPMWFRIDMDRAHLFDSTSGERIDSEGAPAPAEIRSTQGTLQELQDSHKEMEHGHQEIPAREVGS
jgi:multiple sugar transport system ATP-binding protein